MGLGLSFYILLGFRNGGGTADSGSPGTFEKSPVANAGEILEIVMNP